MPSPLPSSSFLSTQMLSCFITDSPMEARAAFLARGHCFRKAPFSPTVAVGWQAHTRCLSLQLVGVLLVGQMMRKGLLGNALCFVYSTVLRGTL